MNKFSFIIPCYNEENDIGITVQACFDQIFDGDYEIIIINDGSKDNSLQVIQRYSEINDKIKVLSYEGNRGVSYARNKGILHANGDVLIFLNADEHPETLFLKKLKDHFMNGADYVFPKSQVENCQSGYGLFRDAYRKYNYQEKRKVMWSQGFACRKEIIVQVGMFNEKYPGCGGEDWDIVSKIDKLSMCRLVDNTIEVKHVVPSNLKGVIWHMYNRGRGTAYNQLIYSNKDPRIILLFKTLRILYSILVLFLSRGILLLYYFIHCTKLMKQSYGMAKMVNKQEKSFTIFICMIINNIIRSFGYNSTILRRIMNGR
jgi:glycosyltransferase involved in cell wall biosynthesis